MFISAVNELTGLNFPEIPRPNLYENFIGPDQVSPELRQLMSNHIQENIKEVLLANWKKRYNELHSSGPSTNNLSAGNYLPIEAVQEAYTYLKRLFRTESIFQPHDSTAITRLADPSQLAAFLDKINEFKRRFEVVPNTPPETSYYLQTISTYVLLKLDDPTQHIPEIRLFFNLFDALANIDPASMKTMHRAALENTDECLNEHRDYIARSISQAQSTQRRTRTVTSETSTTTTTSASASGSSSSTPTLGNTNTALSSTTAIPTSTQPHSFSAIQGRIDFFNRNSQRGPQPATIAPAASTSTAHRGGLSSLLSAPSRGSSSSSANATPSLSASGSSSSTPTTASSSTTATSPSTQPPCFPSIGPMIDFFNQNSQRYPQSTTTAPATTPPPAPTK
jgi:hypothetical protein